MIGVFDSGFGGLVVLREFLQLLPDYDYLYLGDNARIPYGTRSDRVVQRFTEQAVDYLFAPGLPAHRPGLPHRLGPGPALHPAASICRSAIPCAGSWGC